MLSLPQNGRNRISKDLKSETFLREDPPRPPYWASTFSSPISMNPLSPKILDLPQLMTINGSFLHNGMKVEYVELNEESEVVKLDNQPDILKEGQYNLSHTYSVHSSHRI